MTTKPMAITIIHFSVIVLPHRATANIFVFTRNEDAEKSSPVFERFSECPRAVTKSMGGDGFAEWAAE
jgi:hypothetical protein